MALIKVYDLDGQEHEKESVDARECCAVLGWTMEPQEPAIAEPIEPDEPAKRGRKPKGE